MKAVRKSDGKVIEVREWRGASDVVYSDPDMNRFYQASELDLTIPKSDQCISVAKLREVLMDMAMPTNEFRPEPTIARTVDDIINRVKESI